jgi:hypothetical protein
VRDLDGGSHLSLRVRVSDWMWGVVPILVSLKGLNTGQRERCLRNICSQVTGLWSRIQVGMMVSLLLHEIFRWYLIFAEVR